MPSPISSTPPTAAHAARVILFANAVDVEDELFYCSEACAADEPRWFGSLPATLFAGDPTCQPELCAHPECGLPVLNPLSAAGWAECRRLVATLPDWQGDALADLYGLQAERERAFPGLWPAHGGAARAPAGRSAPIPTPTTERRAA